MTAPVAVARGASGRATLAAMHRLIIWGAGELGGRVARLWCAAGGAAVAFTRTEARHERLRDWGVQARTGDPHDELRDTDVLLLSLPGTSAQQQAVASLATAPLPARSVLISSTGLHAGDSGWVDESSPPGAGARPALIAACESSFHDWAGSTGVVLRCGGLYRAGRGPLSELRRVGVAPPGPPDRSLALVHYDDAALAAHAALVHPSPERVYLCVTPPSPTRREYWQAACRVLGAPAPTFEPAVGRPPVEYDVRLLRRDLLPTPTRPDWQDATRA